VVGSNIGRWDWPQRKRSTMNRTIITLECPDCKNRNYTTTKNKRTMTDKLVLPKFCPVCRKHTDHKETK